MRRRLQNMVERTDMLNDAENILSSIESVRKKLNGYASSKELTSNEVVALSQKLDRLINCYYQVKS